jgi:hypothetical protein
MENTFQSSNFREELLFFVFRLISAFKINSGKKFGRFLSYCCDLNLTQQCDEISGRVHFFDSKQFSATWRKPTPSNVDPDSHRPTLSCYLSVYLLALWTVGKHGRIQLRTWLNKLDSVIECISNDVASFYTKTEQRNGRPRLGYVCLCFLMPRDRDANWRSERNYKMLLFSKYT